LGSIDFRPAVAMGLTTGSSALPAEAVTRGAGGTDLTMGSPPTGSWGTNRPTAGVGVVLVEASSGRAGGGATGESSGDLPCWTMGACEAPAGASGVGRVVAAASVVLLCSEGPGFFVGEPARGKLGKAGALRLIS
jgi:hypothetical protein